MLMYDICSPFFGYSNKFQYDGGGITIIDNFD